MTHTQVKLFEEQPSALRRRLRAMARLFALAAMALAAAGAAQAATYSVTTAADQNDGSASSGWSLRDCVIAANANADPSNVISLPAGTYTLSLGPVDSSNNAPNAYIPATGDIDIMKDVEINGAGAATTIIDGADIDRIIDIHGANVTIRNVTLRNATSSGTGAPMGAAIFMRGTNTAPTNYGIGDKELRLENCVISDNYSNHNGGAIAVSGWTGMTPNRLVMLNCTLQNNTAAFGGGAMVLNIQASASVTGCTFSGNTASGSTGYGGGAVSSMIGTGGSSVSFADCVFSNNKSTVASGGAIVHHNGPLSITHCSFANNSAYLNGGAVSRSALDQTASISITGCNFAGNSATGDGGAVFNRGAASTVNMSFCRIVANTAGANGAGVANSSGAGAFNAANNWWGANTGASGAMYSGDPAVTPHLQLSISSSHDPVRPGQTATLTASLNKNSNSALVGGTAPNHVHNTTPVSWSAAGGSIAAGAPATLSSGQAQATFTGGACVDPRQVGATVDGQSVSIAIDCPVTFSGWNVE